MEQLSTDYLKLLERAQEELRLFQFQEEEELIATFERVPRIAGFPYRIALVKRLDETFHAAFRQWDTAHDMNRWSNGIYNLDRLRIIEHSYAFTPAQQLEIRGLLAQLSTIDLPDSLNDQDAIVLDGATWNLTIVYKEVDLNYTWRAATDDIRHFEPLIEMLLDAFRGAQHIN